MKTLFSIILFLILSYFSVSVQSNEATSVESLSFGIVPQQSASKLARLWNPILQNISKQSGINIKFKTAPNIPEFEKRLEKGEYDIAYMNPYHYTVFSKKPGYIAFAKARDKKIKGILVVKKGSSIKTLEDLSNQTIAFPAPSAFAASMLPRAHLNSSAIPITPNYVSSHDSVYRTVAKGLFPAGGGVMRTFDNLSPEIREQLLILWSTKGYTPHAFAIHPRIDNQILTKIKNSMINLNESDEGRELLQSIKIKGITTAEDKDWDDVRSLKINLLKN